MNAPNTDSANHRKPAIVISDIVRSFSSGKIVNTVLKGISLKIYPGELTIIVGPSGSGKSTLLSIMSGLIRPDSGSVTALDHDLVALSSGDVEDFRLHHCGFIFQVFNLFSSLTSLEQVMLMLKYMGQKDDETHSTAREFLAEVGLGNCLHLRPLELSGGEKQRVAIARAMAKQPKLLFADEPTSALDKENGQVVIRLLHRAAQVHGTTILAVTHDPRLLSHADRVIQLEDGRIMRDERPDKATIGT